MDGEIPKGIKLVPADPQARKIGISKKVEEAIRDYMGKNKSKLSNIARMAAEAFTGSDLSRKRGLQDVAKALDVHYIEYCKKISTHRKDEVGIYFRSRVYS